MRLPAETIASLHGLPPVFSILLQAAGSADPAAFRRSDLFRKCQESGLIPRSADDLPLPASSPETAPARTSLPPDRRSRAGAESRKHVVSGLRLADRNGPFPGPGGFVRRLQLRHRSTAGAMRHGDDRCDRMGAVVQRFGYSVSLPGDIRDQGLRRREWARFGISAFLTMNVMMLSFARSSSAASPICPPNPWPLPGLWP